MSRKYRVEKVDQMTGTWITGRQYRGMSCNDCSTPPWEICPCSIYLPESELDPEQASHMQEILL